jgi:hypothetical protein
MTINRTLRIDPLGAETQFVIIDDRITAYGRQQWEAKLTELCLGYTKIAAIGGWRGTEEPITIYRVASLDHIARQECIKFLLDAKWSPAIGKLMRDLYVIHPDGQAYGYSYEYDDAAIDLPRFHGMVETETDTLYREITGKAFHGTRDTGWRI